MSMAVGWDRHRPRRIRPRSVLIRGKLQMTRPPGEEPTASRLLSGLQASDHTVPRSLEKANTSSRLCMSQIPDRARFVSRGPNPLTASYSLGRLLE